MADWTLDGSRSVDGRSHRTHDSVGYGDCEEQDIWPAGIDRGGEYLRVAASQVTIVRANSPTNESSIPHRSAPVNIPDWSRIYGKSKNTAHGFEYGSGSGSGMWAHHQRDKESGFGGRGDEEEDDGHEVVPPHEWIARKLARSQISSSSMCEGIGRTLKGRDLSKVRNAVLSKTGFLE